MSDSFSFQLKKEYVSEAEHIINQFNSEVERDLACLKKIKQVFPETELVFEDISYKPVNIPHLLGVNLNAMHSCESYLYYVYKINQYALKYGVQEQPAFSNLPVPVVYYDDDKKWVLVNDKYYELFNKDNGVKPDSISRLNVFDLQSPSAPKSLLARFFFNKKQRRYRDIVALIS